MAKISMKLGVFLCFAACLQLSTAFLKIVEFYETNFPRCYDTESQDPRRISLQNIHGQPLPLPNSIETFVALLEKYETLNQNEKPGDLATKLLRAFRIDDMDPDLQDRQLRDSGADLQNDIKKAILSVPSPTFFRFGDKDFSEDEECALHMMLSHTINDTLVDGDAAEFSKSKAKKPFEVGVVSLNSKWRNAFALGRVLLGISAGFQPQKEVKANTVLQRLKKDSNPAVNDVGVNPVFAVTLGDLVSRLAPKNLEDEIVVLPNGIWDDISCPVAYQLEDNNNGFVTMAELRGAIDGLLVGKAIQDDQGSYTELKLSQILRMYYGPSGLLDNARTKWCDKVRALSTISDLAEEMVKFNKLLKVASGGIWSGKINDQINRAVTEVTSSAFKDIDEAECSVSETSADRRFTSPTNIFVIMDFTPSKLQFQREIIGNLSTSFDLRQHGNLMGVYTNIKPTGQNILDTIVKSGGIAGCPSCFAKYYNRQSNREDEAEVFRDLNATFTTFEQESDELEEMEQEPKAGSPGKVVLYFNFGSPTDQYRIQEALWEIKRSFGGVTILAVGDNQAALKIFTENEQTDIFTGSNAAGKTAKDIKDRLKIVPGEFQFKDCYQSNPSKEAENKQVAFISPNKVQYWAMYPQYFLKSFGIKLKFKAQEGSSITVCFTRWFLNFIERRQTECKTSNGEEVDFYVSNPCKKRNVYNCEPFFFSVEAKKPPIETCKSLRCSTPRDIQFEFQHEGISCNMASLFSLSNLAVLLAMALFWLHRQ